MDCSGEELVNGLETAEGQNSTVRKTDVSEVNMSGRVETDYSGDTQGHCKGRTENGHNPSEDEMLLMTLSSNPQAAEKTKS